MSEKTEKTENMKIEEIIALAGRKGWRVEKTIEDYFFDFKKMDPLEKKLSLKQAARKSGMEYKLLCVLGAIGNPCKVLKKKHIRR